MGYLHIDNLYKIQYILMLKQCYALEKIHGTSAHIRWDREKQKVTFFAGSAGHEKFSGLFNREALTEHFITNFPLSDVVIYGEAHGGKLHGMKSTYGNHLRFVAFDVKINNSWLKVPSAESICKAVEVEFVDYVTIDTDLKLIDAERDRESVQAIRNGIGGGKIREGIVLRPLVELTLNDGSRVIAKHKHPKFMETKTPREVSPEEFEVMQNSRLIAIEWVTEMRLLHILDKLPPQTDMKNTGLIIEKMIEDIYREADGEIVKNKDVEKQIGNRTAMLFKQKLQLQNSGKQ